MNIPKVGEIYVVYSNVCYNRKIGEEYKITSVTERKIFEAGNIDNFYILYSRVKNVNDSNLNSKHNGCNFDYFVKVFKLKDDEEEIL